VCVEGVCVECVVCVCLYLCVSACKTLQRSDGHWIDSGRLNILCVALTLSEPGALLLQSYPPCVLGTAQAFLAAFKHVVDTLGIEPKASRERP